MDEARGTGLQGGDSVTHETQSPADPGTAESSGEGKRGWLRSKWPRLLVSAALLAFVISRIDRRELGSILAGMDLYLLAMAQLANFCMISLNALRWWVMLRAQGTPVSLPLAIYYYFFGAFFNSFMPTSIGGDLIRVISVSEHTGRKSVALASVVVERLLGFFTLVPLGLVGIALTFRDFQSPRVLLAIELAAMAVFALVGILLNERVAMGVLRLLRPLLSRIPKMNVEEKLRLVYDAVNLYGRKRRVLAAGFAISLLSRAVWIFGWYLVAMGLGLHQVTLARLFTVIPLVELARMAPISLGGIGVREGAFAALMSQFGVATTPAIVLSFLFYFLSVVNGLVGGGLYLGRTFVKR
ncbi:MAG: flippase-like domain-containing protein [Candidatus Eisenbacteria sp.]|nr:flippase-like domain-containing protein [Candidatus Eisenbacteria bacterium]